MKRVLPFLIFGFLLSVGCNKDKRTEDEIIAEFIADNNLMGDFVEDGIYISIENPGNGAHPTIDDDVVVYYEGKYASDGEVFDGNLSDAEPVTFPLAGVIQGWRKGIPYFGVGEKGWLILPAAQAYGSFPPNGVRANAAMAFYIELEGIK